MRSCFTCEIRVQIFAIRVGETNPGSAVSLPGNLTSVWIQGWHNHNSCVVNQLETDRNTDGHTQHLRGTSQPASAKRVEKLPEICLNLVPWEKANSSPPQHTHTHTQRAHQGPPGARERA